MTQQKNNVKPMDLLISFIRNEILNEDIKTEIIKPILIYLLYYFANIIYDNSKLI